MLLSALTVGGCGYRDPYVSTTANTISSGSWKIERQSDRVTGKPVSSAYIDASRASSASQDSQRGARLQLLCFLDKPIAQFMFVDKVGTNQNSFLGYRFDEKPGHEIGARFLQDGKGVAIENAAEVALFVHELATSKVLYVRTRSLNTGRASAEFKVEGADVAIRMAHESCPVAAPEPPPRTAAPPARKRMS